MKSGPTVEDTGHVKIGSEVDRRTPMLDAFVELLEPLERYDYPTFRKRVDDIFGTVDFDPFTGATRVMHDMGEWEAFYSNAIEQADSKQVRPILHLERFNSELSGDGTLAWCDAHFTQLMETPGGEEIHRWQAVATVVFRYDETTSTWIEHRWHASLK